MYAFVGAHYIAIFRSQTGWNIFDDVKITQKETWYEIITFMIESKCRPTSLFYEVDSTPYHAMDIPEASLLQLKSWVNNLNPNDVDRQTLQILK